MNNSPLKTGDLLRSLPPEWPESLLPRIRQQLQVARRKVVVLDDDPTGTQTVYHLPVLTGWSTASLQQELENDLPAFYLLTNTRSMPLRQAQAINREIGGNLTQAARHTGRDFVVVSRSDSTLRGHFPGEVDALAGALAQDFDGWLLIPYFLEGGRFTVNDIHYVAEGEWLTPAAETAFARDAAFGYRHSNLRDWVAEKTAGRVPAGEVSSVSIADIRQGGPDHVARQLAGLANGRICVVNAVTMRDLEVFVSGLLQAEAQGKRYLYRTAASFVQTRAGLEARPLLAPAELNLPAGGGLIVVGSYVPRTTAQLEALLGEPGVSALAVEVEALLDDQRRNDEIERLAGQATRLLADHQDVVIFTSRQLITGEDADRSLSIGQRVSRSLVEIVRAITVRPRYLLAKGGITASDLATQALGIKRAMVLGQILPGVPVWRAGPESRQPGLAYIVFPGNVGGTQALVEVVTPLRQTDGALDLK